MGLTGNLDEVKEKVLPIVQVAPIAALLVGEESYVDNYPVISELSFHEPLKCLDVEAWLKCIAPGCRSGGILQ